LFLQETVREATTEDSVNIPYCVAFLTQVVANNEHYFVLFSALRLALGLVEKAEDGSAVRETCLTLLGLLSEKVPEFVPVQYYKHVGLIEVTADRHPQTAPLPIEPLPLSDVFGRLTGDRSGILLSLSKHLVLCAKSPAIRATPPLLDVFPDMARDVFPWALLSVMDALDSGQPQLCEEILKICSDPEVPIPDLGIFTDGFFLLDRAGYMSIDSAKAGALAERCDHLFQSVRFCERADSITNKIRCLSLDVHTRLHRREAAVGIARTTHEIEDKVSILEKLGLWRDARRLYDPYADEESFARYVACCARIHDWRGITELVDGFPKLSPQVKENCSLAFAKALLVMKCDARPYLPHARKDFADTFLFLSAFEYSEGNIADARKLLNKGMLMNSSAISAFLPMNYEPTIPMINLATVLEEMSDVLDVAEGLNTKEGVLSI
jgi:hypothetical protein